MNEPKTCNVFLEHLAMREEERFREWCIGNGYPYREIGCDAREASMKAYHEALAREESRRIGEQERMNEMQRKRDLEEKIRKFEATIPARYRNASVSDFSMKGEAQRILGGASGLVLGNNGPGKTRFKWAVARQWVNDGESVVIADAQEMLFRIKTADDPYLFMRRLYGKTVTRLVIDEIDKIFESKADFIYLNYLINYRYEWMLQTLVVGNGDTEKFISTLGQSIFARLAGEGGVCIAFNGEDRRFPKEGRSA